MPRTKTYKPKAAAASAAPRSTHPVMAPMMVEEHPYSLASFLQFINNNFALIFLMGAMFVAGFAVGSLWTEKEMAKNGVAAGTGAAVAQQPTEPTGPTPEQLKKAPKVENSEHIRGNKNAKVTLIEYSDFECPFCARFHPTMLKVMEEYGDKVKWVYRHYPLSFHPNAQKAGEASECVAKQLGEEGFVSFSDKIFEENNKAGGRLSPEIIEEVATSTGVNMTDYKKCLDSGEMAKKVTDSLAGGTAAGINGTPGTIVLTDSGDAELIPGALPYEQVKVILDQYVK
jgi:protein-disulfide isomerase